MRAYRARQRGDEEQPTFEAALDDGDELARAVDRTGQLQLELAAASDAGKVLEATLAKERRRTETARGRLDRAQAEVDALRVKLAERAGEVSELVEENRTLRVGNAAQRRLLDAAQRQHANLPNRAVRRQVAKQDRKIR